MNISIMAGGPSKYLPDLHTYTEVTDLWIGVDHGNLVLLERGIVPDFALGDFDSVTVEELRLIQEKVAEISVFSAEKDETDLELAIDWAIRQKPSNIYIFGATGGRMDHFLANIQLLQKKRMLQYGLHTNIFLVDEKNSVTVKTPGSYPIQADSTKKYFSLLSVTKEVSGLSLTGFKYPLDRATLKRGSSLCISNELISDCGNVSFEKGILIIVRSND